MDETVQIDNLRVRYANTDAVALDGVSLRMSAGECLGLVGENGSGKSTFAQSVVGIIPEFFRANVAGTIRVSGQSLEDLSIVNRLGAIAYSFQDIDSQVLFGNVREVLGLGETSTRLDLIEEAIGVLGLEPLLNRFPSELSGGQLQRLAVATALRRGPKLILYDEAVTALDPRARECFGALVNQLSRRGHSLILIGQRAQILAPYAHRMVAMVAGRLADDVAATPVPPTERRAWTDLWESVDAQGALPCAIGLALNAVCYRYGGSDAFTFGPLNAEVNPGEIIALVGENGSGKSTLFKLILGALRPRTGTLRFSMSGGRIIDRARDVSLNALFQNPSAQLIGSTVAEELSAYFDSSGTWLPPGLLHAILDLCPFLRLERDPLELSYGEQKILCLIGLLTGGRGLLLLDEPEQGLDERHLAALRSWLDHLRKWRRQTLLFATHDMELAATCADRVWMFSQGSLARDYLRPSMGELLAAFDGR